MADNLHHRPRRHGFFSGILELDSDFKEKMANLQTFKEMFAYDWEHDVNYQVSDLINQLELEYQATE